MHAQRRLLLSHAPPAAYAPMTREILARLGYVIADPDQGFPDPDGPAPDLLVVDERQLAEIEEFEPMVPIVVLASALGVTGADSRVVGAVARPAGIHDLFRVIQAVLEETPRHALRAHTHLGAGCRSREREWRGVVLSLSENGCLLRSPQPLRLGECLELELDLPGSEPLCLQSVVSYQLLPDLGLVFHAAPPAARTALSHFVAQTLARS